METNKQADTRVTDAQTNRQSKHIQRDIQTKRHTGIKSANLRKNSLISKDGI